jgi:hypothetical protein
MFISGPLDVLHQILAPYSYNGAWVDLFSSLKEENSAPNLRETIKAPLPWGGGASRVISVRNDPSSVQNREVCAHQILEETVQFFLGERTNVIPFVMVAYYDEIDVRRSSCPDDEVGFRLADLDGFVVAHERRYHGGQGAIGS